MDDDIGEEINNNTGEFNVNEDLEEFKLYRWKLFFVIFSVLLFCILYMTVGLCLYNKRTSEKKKPIVSQSCTSGTSCRLSQYIRGLFITTAVSILLCTMFNFVSISAIFGFNNSIFCRIFSTVSAALRTISGVQLNSILWLRQMVFYSHPLLRHIQSKLTKCISWTFFVLMVISTAINFATFYISYDSKISPDLGCNMIASNFIDMVPKHIILSTIVALILCYRILFLGLLLYPLIRHRRHLERSTANRKQVHKLLGVIKRVVLVDIFCAIMFVAVSVASHVLVMTSLFTIVILGNANLVFGLFFVALSFVDWKDRLSPCCCWNKIIATYKGNSSSSSCQQNCRKRKIYSSGRR